MVGGDKSAVGSSHLSAGVSEAFEGLRRCDFVDEMSVDVEQDCAIVSLVDDVVLEYLVVQGSGSFYDAGHFGCGVLSKINRLGGRNSG